MWIQTNLRVTFLIAHFLWLLPGGTQFPAEPCNRVPGHLKKLYKKLTIRRKYSSKPAQIPHISDAHWSNASLFIHFNLTDMDDRIKISKADLLLYRNTNSFLHVLLYRQLSHILVTDVNTSIIIQNRTIASKTRFCLMDLLQIVRRWQKSPTSNQGLLVTVMDTGRFRGTLRTFFPKRNIYLPALALYAKQGNYLARYTMRLSHLVGITINGTLISG